MFSGKAALDINIGGYYLTNKLFTETGLGYISRKLNTTVFLNQGALPPPRHSSTLELVIIKSASFRTLQLPLNFGYNIISRQKMNFFLSAGPTGNFLLSTYYGIDGFKQYEGSSKKNYWQGWNCTGTNLWTAQRFPGML